MWFIVNHLVWRKYGFALPKWNRTWSLNAFEPVPNLLFWYSFCRSTFYSLKLVWLWIKNVPQRGFNFLSTRTNRWEKKTKYFSWLLSFGLQFGPVNRFDIQTSSNISKVSSCLALASEFFCQKTCFFQICSKCFLHVEWYCLEHQRKTSIVTAKNILVII